MEYTGNVTPEGQPQIQELTQLTITKFSVSAMDNNCYLLRDKASGKQLLIDAAANADHILSVTGTQLDYIVTTHKHWDHHRALQQIIEATGAKSLCHPEDAPEIPIVTGTLNDHDTIALGSSTLSAIHLPGHTSGSLAIKYGDPDGFTHIFTGDALFPGGVGKTHSEENFTQLIDCVEKKLFDRHSDTTWIYPGHGKDTTLGIERPHLNAWRKRGW